MTIDKIRFRHCCKKKPEAKKDDIPNCFVKFRETPEYQKILQKRKRELME